MKKLFIIVLYQVKVEDSTTLLSFKKCNLFMNVNNKFIVWDNSPAAINNLKKCRELSETENIEFYHTPENLSLSKIYNYVIKKYDSDIYCIFDQDSEITRTDYDCYIEQVVNNNSNINVFLPQIYSDSILYSPGRFWIFRGSHYTEIKSGIHKDKKYTAITSGMCIRRSVFYEENIWFNEDLNLYGIDTCFFNEYRKKDSFFYVLDMVMKHDLSEASLSENKKQQRIREYLSAYRIIEKKNIFNLLLITMYEKILKFLKKI